MRKFLGECKGPKITKYQHMEASICGYIYLRHRFMTARVVRVVDPNHVHTLLLNCGAFLYIYDLCL